MYSTSEHDHAFAQIFETNRYTFLLRELDDNFGTF